MTPPKTAAEEPLTGVARFDDEGRLILSQSVRDALGVTPGSAIAYIMIDNMLLMVSQDEHLVQLMEQAAAALTRVGLTTQDLLDELPAAGDDALRAAYGDALVDELRRQHEQMVAAREP